jgi:uncharacterized protein YabN with tetrapyrrole methylase and pyrophosphatase domain
MRQRHPHLYGGGERTSWERMKAEKRESLESGLPPGLPALHRAHRLQDRAAGVGFDWPDVEGPAQKVEEELREVAAHLPHRSATAAEAATARDPEHAELEGELGDLLFAVVNLCRKAGVHPALALDRANEKFVRRFSRMEDLARARSIDVSKAGLRVLDGLWEEVKAAER